MDHNTATVQLSRQDDISDRFTSRTTVVYYVATAITAYIGQVTAAQEWLGVHWLIGAIPIGVIELGGIALLARANDRRLKAEKATGYRTLSAVVVAFAVALNWIGHDPGSLRAIFFAGMSALGYIVWLLHSGDRRRDKLGEKRLVAHKTPSYGIDQWVREPRVTLTARILAKEKQLDYGDSLREAREHLRRTALERAVRPIVYKLHEGNPEAQRLALVGCDLHALGQKTQPLIATDQYAEHIAHILKLPQGEATRKTTGGEPPTPPQITPARPVMQIEASQKNQPTKDIIEAAKRDYLQSEGKMTGVELAERYGQIHRWGQRLIKKLKEQEMVAA